jgi:hypothetical protein
MIASESLRAWRNDFLTEFAIDPEALIEADTSAPGEPGADDHIPARYAAALATHADIRTWMADVTRQAIKARRVNVYITTGKSLLLLGITGTGKALADETELATPTGPRAIGSIQPGDVVFGGDGAPCTVGAVYPQGVRPLYRVQLRDGRSAVCDPDHLWPITTRRHHWLGYPAKVMSLAEIMEAGLFYADGSCHWYLPVNGAVEYPSAPLPIDPYTLGALLGDGCFRGGAPSVTSMDAEILDGLRLPPGITAHAQPRQRNSRALDWSLSGQRPHPNPLTVELRKLGLWGHLSSGKFIPAAYLHADEESRLALLAALIDTDGYVKGASVSVSTSSPELAADIQRLVWSLGGHATSRRKETTHLPHWTVHLALPARMGCPARLSRKTGGWQPRIDGRGDLLPIVAVERVADGSATCITVDSPDATYLTADYMRTHNTWQAYGAVRGFAALGVRTHCRVTTAADLYARLRPRHGIDSEDVFEEYAGAPFLVVDDLGAVKNSEWIEEVNYRVVNYRYERMLPTLFTSNHPPTELAGILGGRVSSRLNEMAKRVSLKGEDRRYAT